MTPRQWQIATAALILLAAVLIQFVVLARLPFAGPGLVLVAVVGIAMAAGQSAGAIAGFAAGLTLDILPPADGLMGATALALVVVGYLAGRVRDPRGLAPLQLLGIVALLAVIGAAISTGFGLLLGDSAAAVQPTVLALTVYVVGTAVVGVVGVPLIGGALRRVTGVRRRRRRIGTVAG